MNQIETRHADLTQGACAIPAAGLERVLFGLAGTATLASAALAAFVSPWFLLLAVFVGLNQWVFMVLGACPASLMLDRMMRQNATGGGNPR